MSGELTRSPFIGEGWRYPVVPSRNGAIATATGVDEIEQAIYLILATYPGERPMRPEFGTPIADFIFEPADGRTYGRMAYVVDEALRRWEPRIVVEDVVVSPGADNPEEILIRIEYRIKDDYNRRNLLVPFYRIPGGGDE